MRNPKTVGQKLRSALSNSLNLGERLDEIKLNQGLILSELNRGKSSLRLRDYEFRIFSQCGEDGIIQHLIDVVPLADDTFIEFGAADFWESNCRFLLCKDDWRGFVMDGSADNVAEIQASSYYWQHDFTALAAFITRDNINELLARSGFGHDLGILSIDIDGNDYYVLEAIQDYRPRILICEYNAVFGPTRKISVPYVADFERNAVHYSNLYFGASLGAMTHGAMKKGYSLVGVNTNRSNAFYVRDDLLNDRLEVLTAEAAYVPSRAREGRDPEGRLSLVGGEDRLNLLQGMPVFNVESGEMESL